MTIPKFIEVLQGYEKGRRVERTIKGAANWIELRCSIWNLEAYDFRLVPRSRLITIDELPSPMWVKTHRSPGYVQQINLFDEESNSIGHGPHLSPMKVWANDQNGWLWSSDRKEWHTFNVTNQIWREGYGPLSEKPLIPSPPALLPCEPKDKTTPAPKPARRSRKNPVEKGKA